MGAGKGWINWGEEHGGAMVVVMWAMVIGLAFAAVSSTASHVALSGSKDDQERKQVSAGADGALELATFRENKVITTSPLPCVGVDPETGELAPSATQSGIWCAPVTETPGNGVMVTYRVKIVHWYDLTNPNLDDPLDDTIEKRIVATATKGNAKRRKVIHLTARSGASLFSGRVASATGRVTLSKAAVVEGIGGSNLKEGVVLNDTSTLLGDAHVGAGKLKKADTATHPPPHKVLRIPEERDMVNLPPVDSGDVANPANNDNDRIPGENGCSNLPLIGCDTQTGDPEWNAGERSLEIGHGDSLTLGGANYSFCKVEVKDGGQLIVASGATVRLFFDDPASCGEDATTQFQVKSNGLMATTSLNPSDAQILMANSSGSTSRVEISSPVLSTMHMSIYAPRSEVTIGGLATVKGAMAARNVTLGSAEGDAPKLVWADSAADVAVDLVPVYNRDAYVECTPNVPAGGDHDAGC